MARHIFGLKQGVSGNICYHDEQTIVYPAGANCILFNIDQKSQKFIAGTPGSEGMTALTVSPNRRYVAIAEKGEKPVITIYDLHSLRKRKVLSSSEFVKSNEYVSLAFSPDSKYLVAQSGKPDYTLLYWTWEKSKVMAVQKTSNPNTNAPVYQVSLTIFCFTFLLWYLCMQQIYFKQKILLFLKINSPNSIYVYRLVLTLKITLNFVLLETEFSSTSDTMRVLWSHS